MIKESIPKALEGKIIPFGIKPDRPDPGCISALKIKMDKYYSIDKFEETRFKEI